MFEVFIGIIRVCTESNIKLYVSSKKMFLDNSDLGVHYIIVKYREILVLIVFNTAEHDISRLALVCFP